MKLYALSVFGMWAILIAPAYGIGHMPMPNQYNSLELYQQALKVWETAQRAQVACSETVQLPPMPMPTQYNDLNLYREALAVWEKVGSAHQPPLNPKATAVVAIQAMPLPNQYNSLENYQRALKTWFAVAQKQVQRSAVQPPPLPMPTQYRDISLYNEALSLWEQLFK